jgi:hypothetical protein
MKLTNLGCLVKNNYCVPNLPGAKTFHNQFIELFDKNRNGTC